MKIKPVSFRNNTNQFNIIIKRLEKLWKKKKSQQEKVTLESYAQLQYSWYTFNILMLFFF